MSTARDNYLSKLVAPMSKKPWKVTFDYQNFTEVRRFETRDRADRARIRHCARNPHWSASIEKSTQQLHSFSTWPGFIRLRKWAQKQIWWSHFCREQDPDLFETFTPERFADLVYRYLDGCHGQP